MPELTWDMHKRRFHRDSESGELLRTVAFAKTETWDCYVEEWKTIPKYQEAKYCWMILPKNASWYAAQEVGNAPTIEQAISEIENWLKDPENQSIR